MLNLRLRDRKKQTEDNNDGGYMPSMASNKNLDKKEPEVINNQSNEFVPSGRVRNNVHNPYGVAKEDKKDIF